MTKKAEITPLPWEMQRNKGADSKFDRECWEVGSTNCGGVAIVVGSKDNAAYIVRACNNFPKLVEVLRMLREITGEDWKDSFIGNEPRGKLGVYLTYAQLESIHSAIAAAEGE